MKKYASTLLSAAAFTLYACATLAATEAGMRAGVDSGRNLGTAQATQNPTAAGAGTFNSASGVGDYASLGEPANGGTAGGKASSTYQLTLDCNTTRTKYLGGIGVKYGTCALDASANVSAIPFKVCTKSQVGGICGTGDWSSYQTVNKGGSQTFAGGKVVIKLVSCSFGTCRVTLTDNDQASGTGASLNSQGQQMVAEEGADSLVGQQTSVYSGSLYHSSLSSAGSQVGCYNNNSQSMETDGTVKTCDGQQTASFDPGCETVTECLAQNTTTRTWTETCEAEVPLTTKTCTTTTPTVDCEEKLLKQSITCSNERIVTVTGKAGCAAGQYLGEAFHDFGGQYRSNRFLHMPVTCSTVGYKVTLYSNMSVAPTADGTAPPGAAVHVNAKEIPGAPGQTIGNTSLVVAGTGCSAPFYFAQTCNTTACTIYIKLINSTCSGSDFVGSGTFPLPLFLEYGDGWNDSCSAYK